MKSIAWTIICMFGHRLASIYLLCVPVKCRIKHTHSHARTLIPQQNTTLLFFVFIFIYLLREHIRQLLLCNLAFSRFKICAPFFFHSLWFLLHIYRYQWVSVEQHMAQISYYYCYVSIHKNTRHICIHIYTHCMYLYIHFTHCNQSLRSLVLLLMAVWTLMFRAHQY